MTGSMRCNTGLSNRKALSSTSMKSTLPAEFLMACWAADSSTYQNFPALNLLPVRYAAISHLSEFLFFPQRPSVTALSISTRMPGLPRPRISRANVSVCPSIHRQRRSGSEVTCSMTMMSTGLPCTGSKARLSRPVSMPRSKPHRPLSPQS